MDKLSERDCREICALTGARAVSQASWPERYAIVPITGLRPHPLCREAEPERVRALAESMGRAGQITPIAARPLLDGTMQILSGVHRFEAMRRLHGKDPGNPKFAALRAMIMELDDAQALLWVAEGNAGSGMAAGKGAAGAASPSEAGGAAAGARRVRLVEPAAAAPPAAMRGPLAREVGMLPENDRSAAVRAFERGGDEAVELFLARRSDGAWRKNRARALQSMEKAARKLISLDCEGNRLDAADRALAQEILQHPTNGGEG